MGILKPKRVASADDYMSRIPFKVRLSYNEHCPRWGELAGEVPHRLVSWLYELETDYLVIKKAIYKWEETIAISEEDCLLFARAFSTFQEHPASVLQEHVRFTLSNKFCDDKNRRLMAEKYIGKERVENEPDWRLIHLWDAYLRENHLGVWLCILKTEYGMSLNDFDVSFGNNAYGDTLPHYMHGVLGIVTKDGRHLDFVKAGEEDKVLMLNTYYNDGGPDWNGSGDYALTSGSPSYMTEEKELLQDAGGSGVFYYPLNAN